MHTVAKFVTKAYLVSGSFEHLKEVGILLLVFLSSFFLSHLNSEDKQTNITIH